MLAARADYAIGVLVEVSNVNADNCAGLIFRAKSYRAITIFFSMFTLLFISYNEVVRPGVVVWNTPPWPIPMRMH